MIVPMVKVYVAARSQDRQRLLETIRDLGMIHLVPADPTQALVDEQTVQQIQTLQRALQVLHGIEPHGEVRNSPRWKPRGRCWTSSVGAWNTATGLATLHHQLEQLELWGNLRCSRSRNSARRASSSVLRVPDQRLVTAIAAACAAVVGELPDGAN